MKHKDVVMQLSWLVVLAFLPCTARLVNAQSVVSAQQERPVFSREEIERAKINGGKAAAATFLECRGLGPITQVIDIGDENLKFTPADFFASPGGGEGGGFDKTPVLSTTVSLGAGTCLNAHFSAIVGGGRGVAPLTMFQVTLTFLPIATPPNSPPRHMVGHFERPFGISSPAVFLQAENQADTFGSNFFQKVGNGPHEVRPGRYRVDVWWSGAGPGGALGAAFVLKLYRR